MTVIIAGDFHVRHLEAFVKKWAWDTHIRGRHVEFLALDAATINDESPCSIYRLLDRIVTGERTDVELVYLHIGANDLVKETSSVVFSRYRELVVKLQGQRPDVKIVAGALVTRPILGEEFFGKVKEFNERMAAFCTLKNYASFQKMMSLSKEDNFLGDGLHLSQKGMRKFACNVFRACVRHFIIADNGH